MAVATFMCAITIVWTTYCRGLSAIRVCRLRSDILSAQATILAHFVRRAGSGGSVSASDGYTNSRSSKGSIDWKKRFGLAVLITFDWDVRIGLIRLSQNAARNPWSWPETNLSSSAEWVRQIHPDDRTTVTTRLNMARPDEHSHSMTFRFLRPDGRGEVWLEQIAVTHFDASGMPARINGLTTDVTGADAI